MESKETLGGHSSPFLLQDSPLAPSFKGHGGGGCGKGGLALHGLLPAMCGRMSYHLLRIYACLVPKPVG